MSYWFAVRSNIVCGDPTFSYALDCDGFTIQTGLKPKQSMVICDVRNASFASIVILKLFIPLLK